MKKMSMKKAVEYSVDKRIVIHTPTQEVYDRLDKYAKDHNLDWLSRNFFPEYGRDTCVNVNTYATLFADIDSYRDKGYEIIYLESTK